MFLLNTNLSPNLHIWNTIINIIERKPSKYSNQIFELMNNMIVVDRVKPSISMVKNVFHIISEMSNPSYGHIHELIAVLLKSIIEKEEYDHSSCEYYDTLQTRDELMELVIDYTKNMERFDLILEFLEENIS